jgi:hypothetical protein
MSLQVMDNLVASLSRYTQLLNPAFAKPAIAFGESDKARLAAEAVFNIANQCVSACIATHGITALLSLGAPGFTSMGFVCGCVERTVCEGRCRSHHARPSAYRNWRRYGDSLRSGWRDIMECVMRLHKLGLVPAVILAVDGEPPEVAKSWSCCYIRSRC